MSHLEISENETRHKICRIYGYNGYLGCHINDIVRVHFHFMRNGHKESEWTEVVYNYILRYSV